MKNKNNKKKKKIDFDIEKFIGYDTSELCPKCKNNNLIINDINDKWCGKCSYTNIAGMSVDEANMFKSIKD